MNIKELKRLKTETEKPASNMSKSKRNSFGQKLLAFDRFPIPFHFTLPNGQDSLPSSCGLCFTILLIITIVFYGVTHMVTLSVYGNTDVIVNLIDSYYDDTYVFDLDKTNNNIWHEQKGGLQIAFGLTHYDSNVEMIDEPDYATIHARLKQWGQEGSSAGTTFKELIIRPCTEDDLGLGESTENSKFDTPHRNSDGFIRYYWKKLHCVDANIDINGSYSSSVASHLQIHLEKCDSTKRATCKSDEEIQEWMIRKFMITVTNRKRFN